MNKFMRVVATVSILAAVVLAAASCGRKPAGETARPSLAVIPKGTTHIFWRSVRAGAEKAGEELGYHIFWSGPERETDREKQIQIVEDYMQRRVRGVVLAPLDSKALVPVVEKLHAANIPCVIIDSGIDTENVVSFVATDNYQGGAIAARHMGGILEGKGNVVVVKYVPGSGSTTDRENGFIETIRSEFPNIAILETRYGQDTVETALQATEDLLTRHSDLQGLFACNASTSVGALQALQSQQRREVKMVGFDAEAALLNGLKAGQIAALVVQNPFKMGYEGVKAAVARLNGETPPARIDTGVALITLESIDTPDIKALIEGQ